jgi:hypothetical protein
MVISRSCSTVVAAPSTRRVCSRPPILARPPGASTLKLARAWFSCGAVTPNEAIRSGSMMTLISRSTPPTRATWATPFSPCRARVTVSSMNHDSSVALMFGAETA